VIAKRRHPSISKPQHVSFSSFVSFVLRQRFLLVPLHRNVLFELIATKMKIPTFITSALLALSSIVGQVAADDAVSENRIKVFLFAEPAFYAEVQVDAVNNTCVSLQNNLYVRHLLV